MHYQTAIDILQMMQNGVDPITGEVFPKDHVCCEPDVMEALAVAVMALDAQKNQTAYSKTYRKNGQLNAGRPWTEEDLQHLQALHARGVSIEEICKQLQRRPRGVERQLALLERASSKDKTKRSGPRNSGMPWSKADSDRLIVAWNEGRDVLEMAKELERTPYAIYCRLEACGLVGPDEEPQQWSREDTRELFRMVDLKATTAEMAEHFGRTERAIESRLYYLGLRRRAPMMNGKK